MKFVKMNGTGNDFIILNNLEEKIPAAQLPNLARTLCRRRMSIGADGLMVVERPLQGGDIRMLFFNADGSVGEMCGNGARCICRFAHDAALAGETQKIETTAGMVTGQRLSQRCYRIRLNDPTVLQTEGSLTVAGTQYPCAYVELGQPGLPHAVVPMEHLREKSFEELRPLGAAMRHHPAFSKGANVNFYEVIGTDTVAEKTFERGVEDFTYACGTGSGSVVAVLTLTGRVSGHNVRVQTAGGDLFVDAEREGQRICGLYLTGTTNLVCSGQITDEELKLSGEAAE